MIISRVILKNWRNFRHVDVEIGDRLFLVGPNASGKSNFLDVFRFLRDIAQPGKGGLQRAIGDRNGRSQIFSLSAPPEEDIQIEVHLSNSANEPPIWKYAIGIKQDPITSQPFLTYERVFLETKQLINRPNEEDKNDKLRLTQTYLEQINSNAQFREIVRFFESISYLHLIPQIFRFKNLSLPTGIYNGYFGGNFLETLAATPPEIREIRLKKIESFLRVAVPNLQQLSFIKDDLGVPHLEAIYEHWKTTGAKQREDQFSDGTLRLIGLLWSLLESDSLLLLEEPELSLNAAIVSKLPPLIYRLQQQQKRQIILSTHSADLLLDEGIGGEEVLIFKPEKEGTKLELASSIPEVRDLLEGGLSVADAVLPITAPPEVQQLSLFQ
jgi:predicted ATPase